MKKEETKARLTLNMGLLVLIVLVGILLTVPILSNIKPHADEHQFYLNAFRIMGGKELHNYVHVALTEYALSAFFTVINTITDSGVNFPQGDPTLATEYFGKVFGFILYILAFILGTLILQREDKRIKIRAVIFAVLYFGSLGLFERFLRVNSDSMLIFVFLNFIILSFLLHRKRSSILRFLLLNTLFLFFGTFTNLKSIFIMAPLFLLNTIGPFLWYRHPEDKKGLLDVYWMALYGIGTILGTIVLWVKFIPRPFSVGNFWYTLKNTIVQGTKFDFAYPSQTYNSWAVYIYDFFVEYLGLASLLAIILLLVLAYKLKGRGLFCDFLTKVKNQISFKSLREGNVYSMTEIILFVCFIFYYLGVSSRVVHWSRWGAPLGLLGIMLLSTVIEKIIEVIIQYRHNIKLKLTILFLALFILSWSLRVFLVIDLIKTNYPEKGGLKISYEDVADFLREKNISPEDGFKKVAWINGYTDYVKNFTLENIVEEKNQEVEYLLWPVWNIRPLYTDRNIDKSYHNLVAFINSYTNGTEYRFPGFISYYAHYTELFAAKYLGIAWNTELDSLVENQFGVTKLKGPIKDIRLNYDVSFKDMSHYYSPYSLTFNMATLKDTYMFPPCYAMQHTRYIKDGEQVPNNPKIGPWARTAGLNCHSVRFWYLFKGTYRIRVEGLPDKDYPDIKQMVYSNLPFEWDPETKTITAQVAETRFVGEFGVAIKEKKVSDLRYRIFYKME